MLAGLCIALAVHCSDSSGPQATDARLSVSGVSPASGPTTGGTAVTITGTNFPAAIDSVRFGNGRLGDPVRVSSAQITGTTPASSVAGSTDVTVYAAGAGTVTCSACFLYVQYQLTLTVRQVLPNYGALAGGTSVIVYGTFPVASDVRLGNTRLVNLSTQSGLAFGTTPAGSVPGPVDVTVYSDSGGYQYGICAGCFTYHSTDAMPRYSVTYLGAGFDSSQAVDMNDSGAVVGLVWSAATGLRGRLWTSAGAAMDLDTVLPVAVNNAATVLGCAGTLSTGTQVLWQNGAARLLGGLGSFTAYCGDATDINNRGQVALGAPGEAYLWSNDSLTPLQTAGALVASLHRMNDRGEVAGSFFDLGPQAAVLSTVASRGLGGGRESWAVDVNEAGLAVGYMQSTPGWGWTGGYLWGMGPIPFTPTAINDSLQIVGGAWMWQDSAEATLSSRVAGGAWQISGAVAINERAQIAAYGVNTATGQRGAVRLDPVPAVSGTRATRRSRP